MFIYLYLAILSILIFIWVYKLRKKLGLALNVNDIPNEKRKIHKYPTPKTGSYSIFITLIIFLLIELFFFQIDKSFNFIVIGSILFFIVGFFDDKFNLSPTIRIFLGIFIILLITILDKYFIISQFYLSSFDTFFYLNNFSLIFTTLCILCLINSLNFSDGINGLACGLVFFWLIYILFIYKDYIDINIFCLVTIILSNLILIFYFNIKGHHFLGDAGSLMTSSFVAFLIIFLHNQKLNDPGPQDSAESILIIFLIPFLDMLRLLISRTFRKESPAKGDNDHLHHYLITKFSIINSLIIYFLLVNVPIVVSLLTTLNKFIILIIAILLYSSLIIYLKKNVSRN